MVEFSTGVYTIILYDFHNLKNHFKQSYRKRSIDNFKNNEYLDIQFESLAKIMKSINADITVISQMRSSKKDLFDIIPDSGIGYQT